MGGGGSKSGTQTVINKTELPSWLEDITKQNLSIADAISKRPYQAYGGETIAGFSPEQEDAFSFMKQGIGLTDPLYKQATDVTGAITGYNPYNIGYDAVSADKVGFERVNAPSFLQGDVSAYMNPYISNVEEAAISRLRDTSKQNINRIGDQARAAGAFGGSRQGITEGVALGEAARSAGDLSASLRSQGYNQAAALLQADQARAMQASLANQAAGMQTGQFNTQAALQAALANQSAGLQSQRANQAADLQAAQLRMNAANQMGSLAGLQQSSRMQDAALLENIGMQRQALQQAQLDDAYSRWLEKRNYPIEMLNLRLGATSATPYGTTQTQTGPAQRGNSFLSGLGALGTGVGIAANLASIFTF